MAFQKLLSFAKKVADLADKPALTPTALKQQFDAAPDELRESFNTLIDALQKTTNGDSGAKNIGATSITGISGTDVQTILNSLKTYVDGFLLGSSSGLRFEVVTAIFFTNGGSSSATTDVTFSKAFTSVPTIFSGDVYQYVSYADTIQYPNISNVSTTGFRVKINTVGGQNLGSSSTPANVFMHFLAIGK